MSEKKSNIDERLLSENPEDLYEQAPCGYISTLPDGTIVKINQTFASWLDYSKEEIEYKKKFPELLTIGGKIFYETHHAPLIKMQGHTNELSYELKSKTNALIPVLLNARALKNSEGEISGYKYIFFYSPERKKYEQELLLAKRKAEQAAIAKTDFLSTVSHEIRTPLNAIIGLSHILSEETNPVEAKEHLQILQFSANNLLSLINDILDLSRIESGKVILEEKDINLNSFLQSILSTFTVKTQSKGIQLHLKLDDKLPFSVIADDLKIGQVLINLVGNAVKFTQQGSVTIQADYVKESGDWVWIRFSVTDTGIGIPKDKLEAIFEDFTQASQQITINYGGTGLGLAISKKILELYGSTMSVESELHQGSTFHFTLHLKKGNSNTTSLFKAPGTFGQKKLSGARILLCEDNAVNVLVASKFLKKLDIEFDTAENGWMAVEKIQQTYYDLVLMDLRMPLMDGYEATLKIRALPGERFKRIPILAMTASTDPFTREKTIASQMNGYISKPFDPDDFYHQLIKHIPANFNESDTTPAAAPAEPQKPRTLLSIVRYVDMAEGDTDFLRGILEETILNFKEFHESFKHIVHTRDSNALGDLMHKTKVVIDLLDIQALQHLLNNSLKVLESSGNAGLSIEAIEHEMNDLMHQIIEELQQHLALAE